MVRWGSALCSTKTMRLQCTVTLNIDEKQLDGKAMRLTVKYYSSGEAAGAGSDWALYTEPVQVSPGQDKVVVPIYRLRPSTTYYAIVMGTHSGSSAAVTLAAGTLSTDATGYDLLDHGPIVEVSGDTPSYGTLMFDVETYDDTFKGVVMVDRWGYCVWYHHTANKALAFDQFSDYTIVINMPTSYESQLTTVTPAGATANAYTDTCYDNALDWSLITHEARVSRDQSTVLAIVETVTQAEEGSKIIYDGTRVEYYMEDHVARWEPATNTLVKLFNVEKLWDPISNLMREPNSMTFESVGCSANGASVDALDWSHASAVSQFEDRYVVSLRNIDTVLVINATTLSPAWAVSSNPAYIPSDLMFTKEEDRFFNVHDAQLLAPDTLLVIDDGNNRDECDEISFDDTSGCFTRAARYKIDWAQGTLSLDWQFEFGKEAARALGQGGDDDAAADDLSALEADDLFVTDGGSVRLFENDFYVAFSITPKQSDYRQFAWIFQVGEDARVKSQVKVRRALWEASQSGIYRAMPLYSVFGESSIMPFRAESHHVARSKSENGTNSEAALTGGNPKAVHDVGDGVSPSV